MCSSKLNRTGNELGSRASDHAHSVTVGLFSTPTGLSASEKKSRKKSTPRTAPYRKYREHTRLGFIQFSRLFTKPQQALHPQITSYHTPGHSAYSLVFMLRICPSIRKFTEASQTPD